jgi:pimeloyl-ACP methyl ester carboxylesterase
MTTIQASDGTSIYYQLRGEGTPLLLVMGLGANGDVWADHVAEYEKHFMCVLVDNRGVGLSGKPPGPYTTARMALDVLEVADHLGCTSAHAAGVSMGGAIVQEMALQRPELLRSALIISSWPVLHRYAVRVFEHMKVARAHMRPDDFMELLQLWIFAAPHYDRAWDELVQGRQDAALNPAPQPQHGFEAQADACIFTPLSFSQAIHERIPGSELAVWPGAGHAVHWEVLDEFNARTRDFMLKHDR